MSKIAVVGLYGSFLYTFIGNWQMVFQGGCTISHLQHCMSDPVSLQPCQFFFCHCFFFLPIPIGLY